MRVKKNRERLQNIILYIVLILVALVFLSPLVWVVSTSFKPMNEIFTRVVHWIPKAPTLDHYVQAVTDYPLWIWMKNSFIIAGANILFSFIFFVMPAFALAVSEFRGKTILVFLMMATLMIPRELSAIFSYKIIAKIGILDTTGAVVLPQLAESICVFLMYNFFKNVPREYLESFELDGGNKLVALLKIYLPLSGPSIAVMIILTFVNSWNNFFWPLLVTFTEKSRTLPVGLATIMTSYSESSAARQYGLLMAISLLASLPTMVVFLALQKQFIESVAASGVKG